MDEMIIVCGHYKEIDQRIRDTLVTDEISIGDYVLSGGEIPAMAVQSPGGGHLPPPHHYGWVRVFSTLSVLMWRPSG